MTSECISEPSRLHLPTEIIQDILSDILLVEEISYLNLVCKEFAAIIQPRQFTTIVLHHADRAETLAALCARNERLLCETMRLNIGDKFLEKYEAKELWSFLSTEEGIRLLRGMGEVRCLGLFGLDRDLEDSTTVSEPLALLGKMGGIDKLVIDHCSFSNISKLCGIVDLLHSVRELDIDSGLPLKYVMDMSFAQTFWVQGEVVSLESVTLRRISPWMITADNTIIHELAECRRLLSTTTVIADCRSHREVFVLLGYVAPVAATLQRLVLQNPAPFTPVDQWHEDFLAAGVTRLPCLGTVELIDFTDEFADWLVPYLESAVMGRRIVTSSRAVVPSLTGEIRTRRVLKVA